MGKERVGMQQEAATVQRGWKKTTAESRAVSLAVKMALALRQGRSSVVERCWTLAR